MQGFKPFFMAAPGAAAPCGAPMILFDFDGTLADSMLLCVMELRETFRAMNLPEPPEAELRKCNGPSHEEAAELLLIPRELQPEFLRIRVSFQEKLMDACQRIYPGVPRMLEILSACADLAVVSNGRGEYVEKSLRRWNIGQYFWEARGGEPGRTKGQLVGELIQKRRPVRAAMVGDRLCDIQAGRENGLYTIAAAYGFGTPEEWREADRQAASVEELTGACLEFCGR